ncbi:hypothetical protein [Dokdonia sp. R86516]|uniref:hypothetical protein n=1 Tax=Dokdonia sp. R86516 TaxID=3093856 RepID=UPI0037C63576
MLAPILTFWKSLSYTTRFSIIAFVAILPMGLFSMGILGALLYYPVSFLFTSYPTLNDWTGDWVWPATIGVGMFWSFGFIWAGLAWHFLRNKLHSVHILRVIYAIICWAWAALLWYGVISRNLS